MKNNKIDIIFNSYIAKKTIPNGVLLVRKNDEIIYKMMSMTKPVTAAAIMKLYDDGRLDIDDPISKYISSFKNMRVVNDRRYPFPPKNPINSLLGLITYTPDKAKTEAANRELTFRDLLSHSSGIEQGIGGYAMHFKDKELRTTLERQTEKYASRPLDFQPGTGTGYSPLANFDILARLVEVISGKSAADYF